MNDVLYAMLVSLILTVVFEEAFAYLFKIRDRKTLLLIALINVLTNPPIVLLFYLLEQFTNVSAFLITILLEIMVILVEYAYLRRYGQKIRYPLWLAIGMNAFSYLIGKMINIIMI